MTSVNIQRGDYLKRALILILLVSLSLTLLVGAGFATYFLFNSDRDGNVHDIDLQIGGKHEVEFSELDLIPGESVEYEVNLHSEIDVEALVTLDFKRIDEIPEGVAKLEDYAYARITLEDKVLCDVLISELLDGTHVSFECAIGRDDHCNLKISYYMPSEVGNEAQNAEASFEMIITATNEWSE